VATLALISLTAPETAAAADLRAETIQAWQDYVKAVDARSEMRVAGGEMLGGAGKLQNGQVIVSPVGKEPNEVPSGLIHDWTGATFIPNTRIPAVLSVVRDYAHFKDFYRPFVVEAEVTHTTAEEDCFSMVLANKSLVLKGALDGEFRSRYKRLDDHRWLSVTDATRIREIADFGGPTQHALPEDHGTGLIWRLHSIARFEERAGGVYIELEVVALSRNIPAALRWFIEPLVRRTSRSSLATSLKQTADAVHSSGHPITRASKPSSSGTRTVDYTNDQQ